MQRKTGERQNKRLLQRSDGGERQLKLRKSSIDETLQLINNTIDDITKLRDFTLAASKVFERDAIMLTAFSTHLKSAANQMR